MLVDLKPRRGVALASTPSRFTRRKVTVSLVGAAVTAIVARRGARAEEHSGQPALSEVPTVGGRRPGPLEPAALDQSPGVAQEPEQPAVAPVSIQIEKAGIDAPVERVAIIDGVMQNPSGPWVVSWYEDLAALGAGSNVVMSGHVDYWNVGPAVFWNLSQLVAGDEIHVSGEDGRVVEYAVDWLRNYIVADMTPADLEDVVGATSVECLTLITCSIGSWDPATQQYLERMALRATEVG